MQILFLVFMFVIGAIFGSFFCCQVRRGGERKEVSSGRVRPARRHGRPALVLALPRSGFPRKTLSSLPTRSICLHCKKKLKWYDNVPIISWLILRGKCRFCHKKIGSAEIISELACAIALTMLATTINVEIATPINWLSLILTTIFTLLLLYLAIYDGLTGKLPVLALTFSIICAIIIIVLPRGYSFLVVDSFNWPRFFDSLLWPLLSGLLFGGIYLVLYLVSKGKWVGDGDWLLSLAIGLVLGHPWLSMVALFIANFSACLIMYPIVKKKKNHQIYFGPFLVLAFVITYTFSNFFISMI